MPDKTVAIKLTDLKPSPLNPRKHFDENALKELSESIVAHGILQPLLVRKKREKYEIVIGERRFKAADMVKAQLKTRKVPCIVKELTDQQVMEMQLAENLLREDLTILEEANHLKKLKDAGMKEDAIGKVLGKSQSWVSDRIRMLNVPDEVREHISRGILTSGHVKVLLKLKSPSHITKVVKDLKRWGDDNRKMVLEPTVKETEIAVDRFLTKQEAAEEFNKVYKKAKRKKCPAPGCGLKASGFDRGFKDKKILTCAIYYHQKGHSWDPTTGELVYTDQEIRDREHKKEQAKIAAEKKTKKKGKKAPVHVPTMCAWFFSNATEEQWAEALLKDLAKDIDYMEMGNMTVMYGRSPYSDYGGSPFRGDNNLHIYTTHKGIIPDAIHITPYLKGPVGENGYHSVVTIGKFYSTPSKADNVARGDKLVKQLTKALGTLLKFQNKKVGVKQTMKQIMVKESNGIKLGAKVKITDKHTVKSYRRAGAEVIGFTPDMKAVLNYSKPDKLIPTKNLEVQKKPPVKKPPVKKAVKKEVHVLVPPTKKAPAKKAVKK